MQHKTLYRSATDSVFGGVSGGLGKYFNVDPILFRILFVLLAVFGGGGLIIYIILWIVMPVQPFNYRYNEPYFKPESAENDQESNPAHADADTPYAPEFSKTKNDGTLIIGIILITLGGLFLIDRLIPHINFGDIWPVLLIVAGVLIIGGSLRSKSQY